MARYDPLPYVRPVRERNLRLSDLYLRQGDQVAEGERRRGEIAAQLWGNVGNVIGQTGASMIQAPQMERERIAKEAEQAQRMKMGALQLGEAERAVNDRENFDLAMGAGSRQRTLEALKDRPELYAKAQAHFESIDTSMKKLLGDAAAGIADFGYSPDAAMAAMDDLLDQGFDERRIAPFRAAIQQNPEQIKRIVDGLLSQSPDPRHQALAKPQPLVELNKDTSLYDPNQGKVVAEGPKSPAPNVPNPTEASLAAAAAAGDLNAAKALELMRGQRQGPEPERPSVWVSKGDDMRFVTPSDAARLSVEGWRSGQAREQGRPVVSGDANRIEALNTSLEDLATLSGAIGESGSTGAKAKIGASLPNWVTEWTGRGASAKSKQAVIDRVKQVIGKALEEGVLRKEDERKYEKILPTIGDVPSVVKSKLEGLDLAIKQKRQNLLNALSDAGYDTTRFNTRVSAPSPSGGSGRVYYDANGNPTQKPPS